MKRMLSQYFAQYLLNNRFLTQRQVREALEEEQEHKVKLGLIAMTENLLTAKQVEEVHRLQESCDQRFGEVAIGAGLLTKEQVDHLLKAQESGNLNFGQAVIDKKFMKLEELENAVESYRKSNQLSIQEALNETDIAKIDFTGIEEMKELYCEYVDLFLRTLIRFMDTTGVILTSEYPVCESKDTWLFSQKMTGDMAINVGIMVSEPVLLEMAKRYSGEKMKEVDELALDSVAEYLNLTNGLFVVNLSNRHFEIDLEPQKFGKNVSPSGNKMANIHINTGFGAIRLIIAADGIQ